LYAEENSNILKWNERLNIAVDAAHGNACTIYGNIFLVIFCTFTLLLISMDFQDWIIYIMDVNHLFCIEI
jgi:hypothetical protein